MSRCTVPSEEDARCPPAALICVVDDDESVRTATESLLRSSGYDFETFASAEAFLAYAGPDPACLVCDVQMTGLSGPELFDRLRHEGRSLPTIFVTAFSQDRLRERFGDAVLVLGKPFDGDVLLDAIAAITARSGKLSG